MSTPQYTPLTPQWLYSTGQNVNFYKTIGVIFCYFADLGILNKLRSYWNKEYFSTYVINNRIYLFYNWGNKIDTFHAASYFQFQWGVKTETQVQKCLRNSQTRDWPILNLKINWPKKPQNYLEDRFQVCNGKIREIFLKTAL